MCSIFPSELILTRGGNQTESSVQFFIRLSYIAGNINRFNNETEKWLSAMSKCQLLCFTK